MEQVTIAVCRKCGKEFTPTEAQWRRYTAKDCYPCLSAPSSLKRREAVRLRGNKRTKHGMHNTRVYRVWTSMIQRCHTPTHRAYKDYGFRGILVCDRWRYSFANFFMDMGEPPEGLQLDRIDNNGGYDANNCRWATIAEQARNRRNSRLYAFNGETKCLSEWARLRGISISSLYTRIKRGWSIEDALTVPPITPKRRRGRFSTRPSNTRTAPIPT